MANDIYGYKRNAKPDGVFNGEDAILTFGVTQSGGGNGGNSAEGYTMQDWQISYRQDVREIFELGSHNIYWYKGRPVGAGSLGRIVGWKPAIAATGTGLLPPEAFDICLGGVLMVVSMRTGTCAPAASSGRQTSGVRLEMDGVLITSVGYAMSAADAGGMMLQESIQFRFSKFTVDNA